eukprot:TRINITY_DN785_c0_g1_i1.p1 TRINITY_DN785_c0_g1~~TRINITY_DN785_c0_g1_i1.p1  ORF type:complete len:350 (+),score=55.99 TRINITY_DN785_c0_g1_i1:67-1116(+)
MASSAPYRPPHTWQQAPPEQQARGPRADTQGNEQFQRGGGYGRGGQPRGFPNQAYSEQQGGYDNRGQQRFQGGQRPNYRNQYNSHQQQHHQNHRHQHQHNSLNANSQPWYPQQQQQHQHQHQPYQQQAQPFHQQRQFGQPRQFQQRHHHHHHQQLRPQDGGPAARRPFTRGGEHPAAPAAAEVAAVTEKVAKLQVAETEAGATSATAAPSVPAAPVQRAAPEPRHHVVDDLEGPLDPSVDEQVGDDPSDQYWGAWNPEFRDGKHVGYILERWEEEFDIEDYEDGEISEIDVNDAAWRKVEKTVEDGKLNEVYVHDETGGVMIGFYEGGTELENFKVVSVLWPLEEEEDL